MSDNFTYKPPNEKRYLAALLKYLKAQSEDRLYKLLENSSCVIEGSDTFSRQRWNAVYTTIYFHIPVDNFDDVDEESKKRLIRYCDTIMPNNVGFDVMAIEFSPSVDSEFNNSLEDDLEELSNALDITSEFYLPDDILIKGKEMAEVYLYLYAIENYLRLFIEKVGIDNFGQDYFSKFTITRSISDGVTGRKKKEGKNRWVSIRGDSELFYLDFIDLGTLIQNNWSLFKDYFPDQAWISSKLNELYGIRNLVAHNSYIGDHERDIVRITFKSIIRQLNRQ